jgi:glycosyltransferase involved in cell wall biosynthesis
MAAQHDHIRLLTNMAFWQSEAWTKQVQSIYQLHAKRDPVFQPWWREALLLWLRRFRYDAVITEGVRTSMAYALLCLLTFRPSRQIMTEVFIDEARPDDLRWRIKTWWHGLLAQRALGIITNSTAELTTLASRYGMDPGRLRFVPLNTNIPNPARSEQDDGFVLCAGRTLRDYNTLLLAARHIAAPVIIICGQHDLDEITLPLPTNVTVYKEIPRAAYLDFVRRSRVLALPLLPTERSTGQVVMLEAMAMGKPVVTTASPGTLDTIRHGENGFIVDLEDAAALTHQVNALLRDHELARRIGDAAVADMRELGSAERHARLKLEAIRSLLGKN